VVNGGGFVVTDCSGQRVVFKVDGCGIHGTKEQLILRDGEGEALLLIRRKVYLYISYIYAYVCEKLTLIFIKFFIECACNVLCFCVCVLQV